MQRDEPLGIGKARRWPLGQHCRPNAPGVEDRKSSDGNAQSEYDIAASPQQRTRFSRERHGGSVRIPDLAATFALLETGRRE
jgi:hypothetical protein